MTIVQSHDSLATARPARAPAPPRRAVTRIGYVGLADAAPFFVAKDLGLFERHGLTVALTREVGWATIREKVVFGELDAAHALCPLPFSASLGINSVPAACLSGLILSRGGNAIVLSSELWKRGVRSGETLRLDVSNRRAFRKYILATVFPCSTHAFILRDWLMAAGIDPEADVQMVTLPPSQMCRNLAAGTIDGFCAGDPWASMAISQEIGWSPATSIDISPDHPEKVLMVSDRFAREHHEEHVALIAALVEACYVCDEPKHRKAIARLICDKRRVNCPVELLERSLSSDFDYGMGRVERKPGFLRFYSGEANRPGKVEAEWIVQRLELCGLRLTAEQRDGLKSRVFRTDIFEEGRKRAEVLVADAIASRMLPSL